ncbi:uncharacterized protein PpBr36_06183 [Pyricularia pennisetigena]|uniref:uncharacterized protein n=1 Tax=Pyricularia pennisetigena TaxID=1578925 RepID=UPI001151F830|nr:uncharacterized protein PpBr36_06183 [Pyricularia pennisetigena]TLS22786.1 hypothetical protein PpBr36_06183 [Pyricularia pennisetigena]
MLSQARPRTCTLLRRHVYALSPKNNRQWQGTTAWQLAVPNRIESARWAHQKFRRAKGAQPPPPPSILTASLRDLSRLEVTSNVVAKPRHVSDMLQTIAQLPRSTDPVLYLDSQAANLSRHGDISVFAVFVEPKRHVYLIDVQEMGELAFTTKGSGISLKQVLESADIPKVFFDVRPDADALFGIYGIRLRGVEDVQVMENAKRVDYSRHFVHSLLRCMELDAPVEEAQREAWIETKEKGLALFGADDGSWERFNERPLSQDCQDYCVHQVKWLPLIRSAYVKKLREMDSGMSWPLRTALEARKRVEEAQSVSYNQNSPQNVQGPWGGLKPKAFKQRQRYLKAKAGSDKKETEVASTEPVAVTAQGSE